MTLPGIRQGEADSIVFFPFVVMLRRQGALEPGEVFRFRSGVPVPEVGEVFRASLSPENELGDYFRVVERTITFTKLTNHDSSQVESACFVSLTVENAPDRLEAAKTEFAAMAIALGKDVTKEWAEVERLTKERMKKPRE
jgi:hypothetical protein